MIRHILCIAFTDIATQKHIQQVKARFLSIPRQIEGVTHVEWGINDSQEGKNAGFTYIVLMTFQDDAARQRYLFHPDHISLKAIFKPILKDIIVLDYPVIKKDASGDLPLPHIY
ncbi:Dabb family protein [Enterobacteriaceae bacterium LUAb1]